MHHDLIHEFPEHKERIHTLKTTNNHFLKLFTEYHEVDKAIARAEQRVDLISEEAEEELRKHRMLLKDVLYKMLVAK